MSTETRTTKSATLIGIADAQVSAKRISALLVVALLTCFVAAQTANAEPGKRQGVSGDKSTSDPSVSQKAADRRIQRLQSAMDQEETKLKSAMDKFAEQRKAALEKDDSDQLKRIEKSEADAIAAYERRVTSLVGSLEKALVSGQKNAPKRQNQKTDQAAKKTSQPKKRGFRLFGLGR